MSSVRLPAGAPRLDSIAGVVLLVALLAVALFGSGGARVERDGSAEDRQDGGRRGLAALLEELGWEVAVWSEPPGRITEGLGEQALLWQARAPRTLGLEGEGEYRQLIGAEDPSGPEGPSSEEETEPGSGPVNEGVPLLGELHDPYHYVRFVARGGTLVLPLEGSRTFLVEQLGLEAFDDVLPPLEAGDASTGPGASASIPSGAQPRAEALRAHLDGDGREYDLELAAGPGLGPLDPDGRLRPLVLSADGRVLAVEHPLDAGRVVVLCDDRFVSNGALVAQKSDAALFCVRLLEALDPAGEIAFDEFALGRWQPRSAADIALGPAFGLVTLNALLFLALLLWREGWAREFARDPRSLEHVSPLARARGRAGLLERAGRLDLAAHALRRGALLDLARELRVRPPAQLLQAKVQASTDVPQKREGDPGQRRRRGAGRGRASSDQPDESLHGEELEGLRELLGMLLGTAEAGREQATWLARIFPDQHGWQEEQLAQLEQDLGELRARLCQDHGPRARVTRGATLA